MFRLEELPSGSVLDEEYNKEITALLDQHRLSPSSSILSYLLCRLISKDDIATSTLESLKNSHLNAEIEFFPGRGQFLIPEIKNVSLDVLHDVLIFLGQSPTDYRTGSGIWIEHADFMVKLFPQMKVMLANIVENTPYDLLEFQLSSSKIVQQECLAELTKLMDPVIEESLKNFDVKHSLVDDAFNLVLQLNQVVKRIGANRAEDVFSSLFKKLDSNIPLDFIRKLEVLRLRFQAFTKDHEVFAISHPGLAATMRNILQALQKLSRYGQYEALLASADVKSALNNLIPGVEEGYDQIVIGDILMRAAGINVDKRVYANIAQQAGSPASFVIDVTLDREKATQLIGYLHAMGEPLAGFNRLYEKELAENGRGHYLVYRDHVFQEKALMPEQYQIDVSSEFLKNTLIPLIKQSIADGHVGKLLADGAINQIDMQDDASESYDKSTEVRLSPDNYRIPELTDSSSGSPSTNQQTLFAKSEMEKRRLLAETSGLDADTIEMQHRLLKTVNK